MGASTNPYARGGLPPAAVRSALSTSGMWSRSTSAGRRRGLRWSARRGYRVPVRGGSGLLRERERAVPRRLVHGRRRLVDEPARDGSAGRVEGTPEGEVSRVVAWPGHHHSPPLHATHGAVKGLLRKDDGHRAGKRGWCGHGEVCGEHGEIRFLRPMRRACPVSREVVRHDGGVGTDAHKATGQDCDDGSADHLLLLHIPSAPGSENLRTRRVSTGERGRRCACVRGRNRSTPSPLLLCYPRQPVSLVVTCAPCDEVVLEAEVFDHEEECLLRDHLLLVQPRTISARDPRCAAGISSSPNRRRRQRSRVYSTVRRRSLSPGVRGCDPP